MEMIYRQLSWCMGYIADHARRFFHPAAIEEMLSTFVPLIDGSKLDVSYPFGRYFWCLPRTSEPSCPPVLSSDFLATYSSTILPAHVISGVGVNQLLHV